MTRKRSRVVAAGLALAGSLALQHCARGSGDGAGGAPPVSFDAVLSVKELMTAIVDPIADWVFDAAVIDVSAAGVVETMPLTDEDWLRVEHGAMILAESANLLKMPRRMVPEGDDRLRDAPGGPELTPAEIEAKIDADRGRWNVQADGLRVAALESLAIVRARDSQGLFDAGDKIDRACEGCHLEFWYPGDKAQVLEDQQKGVSYSPPTR